jgi:integrating conjugative element protein (TIGR03752 family)
MKSNGLLKWLLIPVALLAIWIGARLAHSSHHTATAPQATAGGPLTPREMADLGIPADTPRDSVATLVAQEKHLRSELESTLTDYREQKGVNNDLRQRLAAIDTEVRGALQTAHQRWEASREQAATEQRSTQSALRALQQKLNSVTEKNNEADLPVGLGLRNGGSADFDGPSVHWVEPLKPPAGAKTPSARPDSSANPFHFATGFDQEPGNNASEAESANRTAVGASRTAAKPAAVTPVYTVPANATLMGSIAMTALIGRIPVDGTVEDPYPFKVLIGARNLTANGIELPDIEGAVMSGTASGDWTLSCVRGRITSVTFVFRDGTIRTVTSGAGSNGESTTQGGLGWISDSYGIPCVSGVRRSNARQYLTSQMLITAAGAGAASLIRSQNANYSYVAGSNGTTLGTVGISGNEAMGRILAGGVEAMSQWVNKLYGQAFAAVYVPPGAQVAVHISHPITIDYDPHGRRVRYEKGGAPHAAHLD